MKEVKSKHIGCYGVIVEDEKIVLIKKARGGYKGKLDLPGGGIEFSEDPNDTLDREILEEVGTIVEDKELLCVLSTNFKWQMEDDLIEDLHHIGIIYKVKVKDKQLKKDADGLDSLGADWYNINELDLNNLSAFAKDIVDKLQKERGV